MPRDAQFAALTNKNKRSEIYGLGSQFMYIGETIGPLIGGVVLLYFSFKGIASFYIAFLLLAILMIFLFIKETNHRSMGNAIKRVYHVVSLKNFLKELNILGVFGIVLLFFSLLFTVWWGVLWSFGPLFYGPDVLNISPSMGGVLISFFSLPGIFLSHRFGKIADKFGKVKVLFVGLIITGFSLVAFSILTNLILVFASALIVSVGCILSLPALNGLIVDISYKHKKGELAGVWNLFTDAGYLMGPLLGGIIAEFFGLRNLFFVMGAIFLGTSLILLFMSRKI